MLERLTKKNERGFTLAELLVVVAIIAILVAVSIPIFTSQLEKSREATDQANMRAAKAAATVAVLDEKVGAGDYYYNAETGVLQSSTKGIVGYGKGTAAGKDKTSHENMIVKANLDIPDDDTEPTITMSWE